MPVIKNLNTLRYNSERAWDQIGQFARLNLILGGVLSQKNIELMVKNSVSLRDIIDIEVLVNRHELRKIGIEPGAIRILLGPNSFSLPDSHLMVLNEKDLDRARAEDSYVVIAHELTHFRQMLSGDMTQEQAEEHMRNHRRHVDRPHEIDAFFWEAQQATKFGWSREEYNDFLVRLFGRENIEADPEMAEEMVARSAAGLPVLQRRPVRVRRHVRRHR